MTAEDRSDDRGICLPLPRTPGEWLAVFGPGAIVASLTIGTGELVFSTRGGALFGYPVLFVFLLISLMKWSLLLASAHHMLLTGVHPYRRMVELPGPRGWLPWSLLLMCAVCLPIWIAFHAGVVGNLMAWTTGTSQAFHGGADYLWGSAALLLVMTISFRGGYGVLERVQLGIVALLLLSAIVTLVLYRPDWLDLLFGFVPQPLIFPDWVAGRYPQISAQTEWVEATRYVGVIGGAGFDYLAYTSWLRQKRWGVLPGVATEQQLQQMAANSQHPARRWLRAPLIDATVSFALIVAFSAVFVASGKLILGPEQLVPDGGNLLTLQARFVTGIHPWLLPLYVVGALLTMLGTLYGTLEVGVSIADEILRSVADRGRQPPGQRLKQRVVLWCCLNALLILGWLFVRQTMAGTGGGDVSPLTKPRLLLALLTPANLLTGVLSCGLICLLNLWMDQRWLPTALRMPVWLRGLNLVSGLLFLVLGGKGYWDHHHPEGAVFEQRWFPMGGLLVTMILGMAVAIQQKRLTSRSV